MIPDSEQLSAIAGLQEGDLSKVPFAVLLHALAVHRRSVVLEIERTPLAKDIALEHGVPVDCRSNLLHETLERFMVARGQLSEEQGQACLQKSVERGKLFGEVLIQEGLLTASDLYKVLQQNLATKLLDGFTWRSGVFRLLDQHPRVESPLKVNVPQLVLIGISRFTSQEEVNHAIGPLVGNRLFLHPAPPYLLSDIRFTQPQRQLIDLLEGGKRIDELAAETTIPFDDIMRLLYALAVIGIVVTEERLPKEPPKAQAEPLSRPIPVQRTEPELPPERRRNELMTVYLDYRKKDAFDLLGLAEGASLIDIEMAFLEYSRHFAPWTFHGPGLGGLVDKAEELFLAGARAFGELCDGEQRNALMLRRRQASEERRKKPRADRFAIRSDLLDSSLQFKKGKALLEAGKHREALQQFQFAYDLEPQNNEYRTYRAWCLYLDAPTSEVDRALTEFREVCRIDPKFGLAHYYAGLIYSDRDDIAAAERHLQGAIKLMMPDRRPIEALKALSAKGKKRSLF